MWVVKESPFLNPTSTVLQNVSGINLPAAQAAVTGATLYTTNGYVLLDVPNHPVHHCASNDAAMSTRPTRWTGAAETRVPFPRFAPLPAGMGAPAPHDTFHYRGRALGFEADTAGIFTEDFHPDSLWMRATVVHQCTDQNATRRRFLRHREGLC